MKRPLPFFVLESYVHIVSFFSNILAGALPASLTAVSASSRFLLCYAFVLAVTLPLMIFFVKRFIKRLIEAASGMPAVFWNYLWGVPFAFYLVTTMKVFQRQAFSGRAHTAQHSGFHRLGHRHLCGQYPGHPDGP